MSNCKTVFAAIIGRPNVGKSTLLNAIVGEKVAIVSPKPQTTRNRIIGIFTRGDTQFVFTDTPGIHKPRTKLNEFMVREIKDSTAGIDAAVFVVEAEGELRETEKKLYESLRAKSIPIIVAVNKIDKLAHKSLLLGKLEKLSDILAPEEIIPISARRNDGVLLIIDSLERFATDSPHFYDDESYTDQTERVLIAEIIREKLLYALSDEIPHGIAVSIEEMKERPGGNITDISAFIYCEKTSHKGIVIGKNGELLKKIATAARSEAETLLGKKVNLQCWVKVKEDWRNKNALLKQFGLTLPGEK